MQGNVPLGHQGNSVARQFKLKHRTRRIHAWATQTSGNFCLVAHGESRITQQFHGQCFRLRRCPWVDFGKPCFWVFTEADVVHGKSLLRPQGLHLIDHASAPFAKHLLSGERPHRVIHSSCCCFNRRRFFGGKVSAEQRCGTRDIPVAGRFTRGHGCHHAPTTKHHNGIFRGDVLAAEWGCGAALLWGEVLAGLDIAGFDFSRNIQIRFLVSS